MTFHLLTMPRDYNPFKTRTRFGSELCNCKGWFGVIYTLLYGASLPRRQPSPRLAAAEPSVPVAFTFVLQQSPVLHLLMHKFACLE